MPRLPPVTRASFPLRSSMKPIILFDSPRPLHLDAETRALTPNRAARRTLAILRPVQWGSESRRMAPLEVPNWPNQSVYIADISRRSSESRDAQIGPGPNSNSPACDSARTTCKGLRGYKLRSVSVEWRRRVV